MSHEIITVKPVFKQINDSNDWDDDHLPPSLNIETFTLGEHEFIVTILYPYSWTISYYGLLEQGDTRSQVRMPSRLAIIRNVSGEPVRFFSPSPPNSMTDDIVFQQKLGDITGVDNFDMINSYIAEITGVQIDDIPSFAAHYVELVSKIDDYDSWNVAAIKRREREKEAKE